jgi:hypothetical protein
MKKIGLLCLALVLALGALGVGYAMWSDTVTLNASVTTDDVDLCISEFGGSPPFTNDPSGGVSLDHSALGSTCGPPIVFGAGQPSEYKDVASTDVSFVDCHTLAVTVNNAYPYYAAAVDFEVCNTGSVPVKLWYATVSDTNGHSWTIYTDPTDRCLDIDGDGEYDMIIRLGDSWGNQKEPDECYDLSFSFVFLQPLDQGLRELHFTITWTVVQWNEYAGL